MFVKNKSNLMQQAIAQYNWIFVTFAEKSRVMFAEPCPLCRQANCIEDIVFHVGNKTYHGLKCTNCNAMLHSHEDEVEKRMNEIEAEFHDLSARMDR